MSSRADDPVRPRPLPQPPEAPAASWRQRHRKWFLFAVAVAVVLVFSGLVALLLHIIVESIKSSDAYVGALERVRTAPAVTAALGTPLEEGYFVRGTIHVSGPTGLAELAIPVAGPKGRAMIYVEATRRQGEWHFDHLIVAVERTRARIDLAPNPPPPPPASPQP